MKAPHRGSALTAGGKPGISLGIDDAGRYVRKSVYGASSAEVLDKAAKLRLGFDLDEDRQLILVRGLGLDGDYQFDSGSLMNLSLLSTEGGYGKPLTPTALLTLISQDAQVPRPAHLDELGPIRL